MIKKLFKDKKIAIIIVLVLGFAISSYANRYVFLSNTPRVNRQFVAAALNTPSALLSAISSRQNNAGQNNPNVSYSIQQLQSATYKQVSQGVYAADVGELKVYKVSESQTNWSTITLKKKNGETVTLQYPKDNPPTQEMLQIIESE